MSTPQMTTPEALRSALASTIACSAQELQEAIGQIVVATAAELPASATAGADARSVFDPQARTTVLLADRIPAGQEAQALAEEIERHHGRQAAQAVLVDRVAELLGGDGKVQENVTGNGQRAEAASKSILGLDSKGRAFRWADELVEFVNQLSAEYESWCKVQKVPYIRMDDQDAKGYYLTQSQRADLAQFRERWNALEQAQVDSRNRSTSMEMSNYIEHPPAFFDSTGVLRSWETADPLPSDWTGIAKRKETLFVIGKEGGEMSYTALQAKTMADARDEISQRKLLKYTRSSEDSRGLHIVFGEPITPANFLAACNAAIDLAKIECSTQTAVAIVFEAKGVEVQVTETDSAEVQLALWERKLSNFIEHPESGQPQEPFLNTEPSVIEAKVMKDYAHFLGKDVLVSRISGFVGDDSTDIELSPPAKVRVESTSEQSLKRWIDGWCDPLYEVALVEEHPQLKEVRSLWIHGPSLHLNGKQTEASDIVSIADPQTPREVSNYIELSTERCRMDDLVGKEFQILAFRDLPVTHQLAIAHYLSNDCGSWQRFYEGGKASLSEYLREYGDQRFGVIDLPSQRVVQSVMADPELATSYSSWEQYAAWYCTAGDVQEHDPEHRWPVILSQDNDETLRDGWHRFHGYMRSGCNDIPAVFFPAERHYELIQRKGATSVKDDSTRKMSNYTAGQNHEPLEHEMAEYVELEVTLRSKTTFGTDKETIRVWDGQSAKDVAERTAQGYGAEVVEIRNPDGSIYEEAVKVEDSPSPGM